MSTKVSRSLSAASMLALAFSAGLPPLGQQTRLAERPNAAGERLRPPPRRLPKREPTSFDLARIAKAAAKRERRAARDSWNLFRGCARQTATPMAKATPDGSDARPAK